MALPTERTPRKEGYHGRPILIYGHPKIGKSTFCSQIPDALFLATEAGLNDLEVYQTSIATWEDLQNAYKELKAGAHPFKAVVIDTIDSAYRLCAEYTCAELGIVHESDAEWGKGWAQVTNRFRSLLLALSKLPYSLWLIGHATEREVKTRVGPVQKVFLRLPKGAREAVLEMVDFFLFVDYDRSQDQSGAILERRVIRTRGSQHFEAGCRLKSLTLPESIALEFPAFAKALEEAHKKGPEETPGPRLVESKPKGPQAPGSVAEAKERAAKAAAGR